MNNKLIFRASTSNAKLAAQLMHDGEVIIYPTDTLFSFGADASNDEAIDTLNKIKMRLNPLSILLKDVSDIDKYAKLKRIEKKKLNKIFPGPFTALLPSKNNEEISKFVQCNSPLIGIRIINHKFCNKILSIIKKPIITTSVNIHGDSAMVDMSEIVSKFKNIHLFYNENKLISKGSTIIDFSNIPEKIIRQGQGIYR